MVLELRLLLRVDPVLELALKIGGYQLVALVLLIGEQFTFFGL